jgi:hypothetical protein
MRLFKLGAEVSLFPKEKENPLLEHFERKDFVHGLAYVADIFNYTNDTFPIQGPEVTIMDTTEKLQAFLAKVSTWKKKVEADILANFQILVKVLHQDGVEIQNSVNFFEKRNLRTHGHTSELFQNLYLS